MVVAAHIWRQTANTAMGQHINGFQYIVWSLCIYAPPQIRLCEVFEQGEALIQGIRRDTILVGGGFNMVQVLLGEGRCSNLAHAIIGFALPRRPSELGPAIGAHERALDRRGWAASRGDLIAWCANAYHASAMARRAIV